MITRLFCLILLTLSAPRTLSGNVSVFAAASLTDALKEIASIYQKQSGDRILFNFGASSVLARQIEEGAPADLFFSADEAKMDALQKKGLVVASTRQSRLSNRLVIVVARNEGAPVRKPEDLLNVKRLALGEPSTVPAGIYARKYLQRKGLWDGLTEKIVPTDNVRAALAAVEAGNVDAAIVYKTDAAITRNAKVVFEVPTAEAPSISYPLALLTSGANNEAAQSFLKQLNSKEATQVFEKFGFLSRR
jgi:molybdate transport system substrate-binding protein